MNPDKFTYKTNEALVGARELATSASHAQFTPLHLAFALIYDLTAIFFQAISNVAGEESARGAERVFNLALKKFPSQSPSPDEVPARTTLIKEIRIEGSMDASNLVKPMLASGQPRCIGATTLEEYRKYVEKNGVFKRRFQHVYVAEPI